MQYLIEQYLTAKGLPTQHAVVKSSPIVSSMTATRKRSTPGTSRSIIRRAFTITSSAVTGHIRHWPNILGNPVGGFREKGLCTQLHHKTAEVIKDAPNEQVEACITPCHRKSMMVDERTRHFRKVVAQSKIGWDGSRIVIPIFG